MKLVGIFWIAVGILWVIRPDFLRGWFVRKTNFKAFWLVAGVLLFMLFHLGGLASKITVPALRTFCYTALLVTFILLWMTQSMAREKMRSWFQKIPLLYFQAIGVLNILTGASLLYFKK